MMLEGRNAAIEALRAGMPLKRIVLAEGLKPDRAIDDAVRMAQRAGVAVESRPRKDLDRMSERGAHQGIIAEARPFRYQELPSVLDATRGQDPSLIIALDHVTDPGNFGAIARTAEVVGSACLITTKRRSAAITAAAWKSAAGALAHVPVVQEPNLVRALETCKTDGYWIAGASERAQTDLWRSPLEGRIVLVMGSEGEGLARLTAETCDFLVSLPQAGKVGSLNVAQATTAIAYEWLRRSRDRT